MIAAIRSMTTENCCLEIVEQDRVEAGFDQLDAGVRADVAGAAGQKDRGHSTSGQRVLTPSVYEIAVRL